MCCYSTVQYSVTIMCVLPQYVATVQYSTALLLYVCLLLYCVATIQYSTVQRYCYVCVLLQCVATVQ